MRTGTIVARTPARIISLSFDAQFADTDARLGLLRRVRHRAGRLTATVTWTDHPLPAVV